MDGQVQAVTAAQVQGEPLAPYVVVANKREPSPILVAYAEAAAEVYPLVFIRARCVNSTWVCLEIMRRYGLVSARALSVEFAVMNRRCVEEIEALGRMPTNEEALEWLANRGVHMVQIDTGNVLATTDPNAWPGHVVAIVQGWLVDSAISQVSRPEKQIIMPEILLADTQVAPKFLRGKEPLMMTTDEGALARYNARLADRSYEAGRGFRSHEGNQEVADAIHRRMQDLLGHPGKERSDG